MIMLLFSALMTYCLSRKFSEASPSATDRWIMLNRNLRSIFKGIFESGKLSFAEIGSKLLDRNNPYPANGQYYNQSHSGGSRGSGSSDQNTEQYSGIPESIDMRMDGSWNNFSGSSDPANSTSPRSSPHGSGRSSEYPTSPEEDNRSLSDG